MDDFILRRLLCKTLCKTHFNELHILIYINKIERSKKKPFQLNVNEDYTPQQWSNHRARLGQEYR